MALGDGRLSLRVRPLTAATSELDVVMIGHCPGIARWRLLLESPQTVADIVALGFGAAIAQLQTWAVSGEPEHPTPEQQRLLGLFDLPIPMLTLAQFQVLFKDAAITSTRYRSQLAGDSAWLPMAVEDFFQSSQPGALPDGAKKLWVIRVAEDDGQQAFLPDEAADYSRPETLRAFDRALLIPELGLLAMPDLERVQIPANLIDVRRKRLANPDPVFLPCTQSTADDHRERRRDDEIPEPAPVWQILDVLKPVLAAVKRRRPDVQVLLTLPIEQAQAGGLPNAANPALATIAQLASVEASGIHAVQFLFPYLTRFDRPLASPVGLVAGAIVETTQRLGPWRSVAGRALPGLHQLYPNLQRQQVGRLRQHPGVGVLCLHNQRVVLDDERRAAPVVSPSSFTTHAAWLRSRDESLTTDDGASNNLDGYRSGEVARFMAWLHRRLLRMGERWLFNTDVRDPMGTIQLRQFFTALHRQGALRGTLPEQAFSVSASHDGESTVIYRIELAPVFPIDRIVISFSHNLGSNSSAWQQAVVNG